MNRMRNLTMTLLLTAAAMSWGQESYRMAGPYEVVARDGDYRNTKGGSERDMKAALDYAWIWEQAQNGANEDSHLMRVAELAGRYPNIPVLQAEEARDKALEIINAYAHTLQRLDGHDAPLCALQGYELVQAMTLMREFKTDEWDAMLHRAWLPTIEAFEQQSPYANGNWGAIVNRLRMACAVYLDDDALYRQAVDYYLGADDNGALPHYVGPTGQCQETGRDQNHVQLGLEALCHTCEMAWQQGDDLWGTLDNRLCQGIEYTARYNLGHEVPFETWTDCTGLYCHWDKPGAMGRGRLWDIYALPYRHYHDRMGIGMPYTRKVLKLQKNDKAAKRNEERLNEPRLHQTYVYPAPEGAPLKDDYEVFVQSRGSKEWMRVDTYMAKVNAADPSATTRHRVSEISYAQFDFEGDVNVKVVCKKPYHSVRIRPDYRGVIANAVNDTTVQFLLFQPENLSVEFDDDIAHNLLLFTSAPVPSVDEARQIAKTSGRTFAYVAPGYYDEHNLSVLLSQIPGSSDAPTHQSDETASSAPTPKAVVQLPAHTTVYLAPGCYINGTLAIEDTQDVQIVGRGICRPTQGYEGCHVHRSKDIFIDGLTVCTLPIGGSNGVKLHDVRSISHPGWGDGLNVFASENIHYERIFCRNSDDCTTAYCTRKGFEGNCRHITMDDAILWADVAHPIFIGLHGNAVKSEALAAHPERGDTCAHLLYRNIDILGQAEAQTDYQGCLAINCGDNNLVYDVTFDNIRIEDIRWGSLVNMRVCFNSKYCAAPGRGIRDVTFNLIRYHGSDPELSILTGYDDQRPIEGVRFNNVWVNGRHIFDQMEGKPGWYKTSDMMPCFVGNHVRGVTFE